MGELVAIFGIVAVFGIPISAIWTSHAQKMAKIKAESGGGNGSGSKAVLLELQALRWEVANLRETTTRFDMSFDAALTRVETRLDSVEQTQAVQEANAAQAGTLKWEPVQTTEAQTVTLSKR